MSETVRETERRKLNVVEGLILFVLTTLLGGVVWLSKSTIQLVTAVQYLREDVQAAKTSAAGLPDRVTKLEVKGEAQIKTDKDQDDAIRELRQMRGLQ